MFFYADASLLLIWTQFVPARLSRVTANNLLAALLGPHSYTVPVAVGQEPESVIH